MADDIVGYRLNDFVDRTLVDKILNYTMPYFGDILLSGISKHIKDMTPDEKSVYFTRGHVAGSLVKKCKDLKILDIWFTPIYASEVFKNERIVN